MAYATVAELATHLGAQDLLAGSTMPSDAKNARWESILDAASRAVDQDCGRSFASRTATKTFAPDGGTMLRLPDLVSVTTLKVDADGDGTYETTLTTADYELGTWHDLDERWPYEYAVRLGTSWPQPYSGTRRLLVQINGTWGWSAVPAEIKQATLLIAARLVQRSNSALGVQGVTDFGPFSIRNTDPDAVHLIAAFRKMVVA